MVDDHAPSARADLEAAWRAFRDGIDSLRETLHGMPITRTADDHAAADRWLFQAQAAAQNLVLAPEPRRPRFLVHTVFNPSLYSWLLPNADFLYRYAFLHGAGTYRIEGVRRNAHFLDAQTLGGFWGDPGMKLMETHSFDELGFRSGDRVEIHVGPDPPEDGQPWIRIDPSSERTTLIVREAFYDWESEGRSSLRIEPTGPMGAAPGRPGAAETARRLDAALRMITFCHETFSGQLTANVVDSVGYNRFLLLDTSRDEDAANPVAGYVPVVFDLAQGEALVVEFELPSADYWGLQLGDLWWQCADYVDHQSSLNGRQVVADSDGRVRIVVGAEDPGVANWLDTAGIDRGVVLLRWYRADHYPVPEATRMRSEDVMDALPEDVRRISPEERRRSLVARRAAVLRRYDD